MKNNKISETQKKKMIRKKIIKSKPACIYCKCNYEPFLTIDHVIPLGRGGIDESTNMVVTCKLCNCLKAQLNNKEFKIYRKSLKDMIGTGRIGLEVTGGVKIVLKPLHFYPGNKMIANIEGGNKK